MSPLTEPTKLTLKSYGTPAAIAGVAPTLDYRFALDRREIDAVSLTDKLIVTRAATCAINGSTGYLELANANVPRFDHNPSTNQSLGLLVEGSSTNFCAYSENLTAWIIPSLSATIPSPVQGVPAYLVTDASNLSLTSQTGNISVSLYCKAHTSSFVAIRTTNWSSAARIWFNIANGSFASKESSYIFSESITPVGNGWYRVSFRFNSPTDLTGNLQIFATTSSGSTSASGQVGVWGIQLEDANSPSSYIRVPGSSPVTRTESVTIDGTGVITGAYTMVEKPSGCAVVNGGNIDLVAGYTAERVMVFPAALSSEQITAIRSVM